MVEVELFDGSKVYVKSVWNCCSDKDSSASLEVYRDENCTDFIKELPYTPIPDQEDYDMKDPFDRHEWETEWDKFVDMLNDECC